MNDQYTPLLVYCNAIGLPPLASRPARTALLSPMGPEGYLALGPHLTTPGAYPVHLVNPSKVRLEMLFDMGGWPHSRASPLCQ
jgi:hypothetical protein